MQLKSYDESHKWCDRHRKLVLLGPPGTGKTRTALVDNYLPAVRAGVENILFLSFSNAAADEMRDRAAVALGAPDGALRDQFSTIHSAALKQVKRFNVGQTMRLYDGLTRTVVELNKRRPDATASPSETRDKQRKAAMRVYDTARATLMEESYAHIASRLRVPYSPKAIEGEIEKYLQEKRDADAIDFHDMLDMAVELPAPPLDLLLVDEAQDCSRAQWRFISHIARGTGYVVIVGDPDQLVHEWAGATAAPLVQLIEANGWEAAVLAQSYRVPSLGHAAAMDVINLNRDRVPFEYRPLVERHGAVRRSRWDDVDTIGAVEGAASALVLARTNKLVRDHLRYLKARGAKCEPVTVVSKAMRALLELRDTGTCQAEHLRHAADRVRAKLLLRKGFKKAGLKERITGSTATSESSHAAGFDLTQLDETNPHDWLVGASRKRVDYLLAVGSRWGYAALTEEPTIRVMTMHRAKGLEADVVVVDATRPQNVARSYADVDRAAVAAERRLLYVALTRSRALTIILGHGYDELDSALVAARAKAKELEEVPF